MSLKNKMLFNESHLRTLGLLLIVFVLFQGKSFSQKSHLPMPEAYYPLRTVLKYPSIFYAKYLLLEPWDKSINGRHGTLVNDHKASSTPGGVPTWNFQEGSFPLGGGKTVTNVKKTDKKINAYVSIPNPYDRYNFSDGATISFWYYWDGNGDEDIITTKDFIISAPSGINGLTIKSNTVGGRQVLFPKVFEKGNGWYFIAFAIKKESTTIYSNYYKERVSDLDESKTKISDKKIHVLNTSSNNKTNDGGLMKRNFDGQLRDVRFYKELLSAKQINEICHLDYDNALDSKMNKNSHLLVGNYNYYSLGGDQNHSHGNYLADSMHLESNGIAHGQITPNVKDRFNTPRAVKLEGTGTHIKITNPPTENYDLTKGGLTVSLWVKTPKKRLTSPIEGIDLPFTDADTRYMQFYGYNNKENEYSFGIDRVNDRVGVIRTGVSRWEKLFPWTFWYYDPASYRDRVNEWVHIIYVQNPNWQRIYVENGDNDFNCECEDSDYKCWEKCQSRYNYQGVQKTAKEAVEWGIGNFINEEKDGITYGNEQYIDDVRVYRWPLSRKEVHRLHNYERLKVDTHIFPNDDSDDSDDLDKIVPVVVTASVSAVLASTFAAYKFGVFRKIRRGLSSYRMLRLRARRFLGRSRYSRVSSEDTEMQEVRGSGSTESLDSRAQELRMRGRACD